MSMKKIKAPRYVVVRTYSAGVHVGRMVARSDDGKRVRLDDARRIWSWRGAETLHEIADAGVGAGSKVSNPIRQAEVTEAIEVLTCTAAAETNLRGATWAK